jgi:hypothetical protein
MSDMVCLVVASPAQLPVLPIQAGGNTDLSVDGTEIIIRMLADQAGQGRCMGVSEAGGVVPASCGEPSTWVVKSPKMIGELPSHPECADKRIGFLHSTFDFANVVAAVISHDEAHAGLRRVEAYLLEKASGNCLNRNPGDTSVFLRSASLLEACQRFNITAFTGSSLTS